MKKLWLQARAIPPMLWILSLGCIINLTGMSFLWPLNTIYIHQVLGHSLQVAGFVLMLQQAAALLGNMIGGWMFDRWGGRVTVTTGLLSAIMIVLAMGQADGFLLYATFMTVYGLCFGLLFPSINALASAIWPEGGRRAMNIIYVSQNLGVALGSALGGWLASISFDYVFIGNAVTYALFLILFLAVIKEKRLKEEPEFPAKPTVATPKVGPFLGRTPKAYNIPLLLLSIGFTIAWISYVQWQSTISVYVQTLGISLAAYSFLWTLNGAFIVLGQPLSNWFIRVITPSLKGQITAGVFIYALALVVVAMTDHFYGFILAMLIMTFGEMLVWPGVPAMAAEMAPKGREGRFQGIVASSATAGRMMGPLLGGTLYESTSPQFMFYTMIFLCFVAASFFLLHDRRSKASGVGANQTSSM